MFKKITAILLSITLLLTISPVTGVFAAVTETSGTLTEDFEGMNVTDEYFGFTGSQLENHKFFTNSYDETKTFNGTLASYKIVKKQGADGQTSKMLEMRSPVGTSNDNIVGLGLPSYVYADHEAGKRFTYSFDFCIENIPDSAVFKGTVPYLSMFYYNTGGGLFSNSANFNANNFVVGNEASGAGKYQAKLTEGSWYRAEMVADGGSDGNNSTIYIAVYDKNTGTALFRVSDNSKRDTISPGKSLSETKPHQRLLAGVVLAPVATENTGFTVLIDNAEYRVCKPASAGPALKTGSSFTEATIKNGDAVGLTVGEATVAFDQKLAAGYKATLTPAGDTPIECDMTEGKAYANSYFYTVTIPELEAATNYTLSFGNCKNSQSVASASTITFKTLGAGPAIQESTLQEGGEISPIGPKATVTFDQLLADGSEVVVYKDGGEELPCTYVNTSGYTYEITLPELEDGENYTLDFTGCFNAENTPSAEKISFTTTVVRIVKLTDDFENEELLGDENIGYNTSKASASPLTSAKRSTPDTIFLDAEGYDGSKAIKLSTVTDDSNNNNTKGRIHSLCTTEAHNPEVNPENEEEYQTLVSTYRINVKKPADFGTTQIITNEDTSEDEEYTTSGADINFLSDNSNSLVDNRAVARIVTNTDGDLVVLPGRNAEGDSHVISGDKWYNIVWVIDGKSQTFAMIDEATGEVIFKSTGEFDIPDGGHKIQIFNGGRTRNSTSKTIRNQNQVVLVDDFTLWKIKPWETEHKLTAVLSGDNTKTMTFNQPVIATESMFGVYKDENKENEYADATPVFTYPDFCKMTVGFKGLRFMSDYTVDYSGVTSAGGAGFANTELATKIYSIATGKDPKGLTLIGDISYSSLETDDVVTADIQNDTAGTACIFIAFYDSEGNILGADVQKDVEFAAGVSTRVEFTLKADMSECKTIKVFGWDSLENITPIMSVYVEHK